MLDDSMIESVDNDKKWTYDEALTKVGGENKYQKILLVYLGIQWLLMSFVFMGPIFWLQDPEYDCGGVRCKTREQACQEGILVKNGYETITTEFNLYCGNSNLKSLAQSMIFIGSCFGSILITTISDKIGRRPTFVYSQLGASITMFVTSFSVNVEMYMVFTFLSGFFLWPVQSITYALVNESTNGRLRQIGSIGLMCLWSFGEIVVSPLAYLIKDWSYCYLFCIGIPQILMNIPNFLFTLETPIFLLSKDRIKGFEQLNKIAVINNRPLLDDQDMNIDVDLEQLDSRKTFLDLFKYDSLRALTISASLLITFVQLIYFGSSYSLGSLDANIYISTLIVGGCENFANLIGAFMINHIPRRKGIFIFHTISVVVCLLFWVFNPQHECINCSQSYWQIVLASIIRVFNILTTSLFSIYINEIFPTAYRTIASGFIFSISILGSFAAPYLTPLAELMNVYPIVVLGLFGSLGSICPYFFKETLGKPINTKLEESLLLVSHPQNDLKNLKIQ